MLSLRTEQEERVNNEQIRQTETNRKMVDLNTSRPIIILNVNGLNTMNKLQESSGGAVGLLCVKNLNSDAQC